MAYTKISNKTQDKDVNYLNKDYNNFKTQLMDFARVYFPDNFNDFSEGNPGMMFLDRHPIKRIIFSISTRKRKFI